MLVGQCGSMGAGGVVAGPVAIAGFRSWNRLWAERSGGNRGELLNLLAQEQATFRALCVYPVYGGGVRRVHLFSPVVDRHTCDAGRISRADVAAGMDVTMRRVAKIL